MKQSIRGGGGTVAGSSIRLRILSEEEVEVIETLRTLPKLFAKSELLSRYSFTWGRKKKRSVLVSKSDSSALSSRLTHRPIDESSPEKVAAADAGKSPTTPLCFLPCGSGSGSDGGDKPKHMSSVKKTLKRKATNNLIERYNGLQQERQLLVKKLHGMKNLHQQLISQNLELKAKRQKISYSKSVEDSKLWNSSMKSNFDQHRYHQQITVFTPPPQQHFQQFVVDPNNGKLVAISCSSSSNRFGLFNQFDPRVNKVHGETHDFMASSQQLDQNKYLLMDNDLRVRNAASARKNRIMRMKKNKKSFLEQNTDKLLVIDHNDLRVKTAADARKRRITRMKESKNILLVENV